MPRHLTQHSGGVILSTKRIDEQVPVERAAMESRYIAQWGKDSVADAGFFKLDILGYPTLDQLELGLKYVYERHGKLIKPEDIDLTDQRVYEMIQRAGVIGIVQIQSRAQQQILLRIKIARIEDLIIQVALIRPGPIQGGAVHPYVARCLGQEPVTYDHPSLDPPEKSAHPGEELAHGEGLGEVVVGPDLEAEHAVDLLGAGGEDQDRDDAVAADAAAYLQAIERRQHPVQDDQVGAFPAGEQEGAGPVERLENPMSLVLQVPPEQVVQVSLVFCDQDGCHERSIAPVDVSLQDVHGLDTDSARAGDRRLRCWWHPTKEG